MGVVAQSQRDHPPDSSTRTQPFGDPLDEAEEDLVERRGRRRSPPQRSLRTDRRAPFPGDDPPGVVVHGQCVEVASAGRAQHRYQRGLGQPGDVTDGVQAALAQLVGRHRPDAPEPAHVERMQELELVVGVDHEESVGLADPRGHLGQELGAGHAHGDGEPDLGAHPVPEPCCDGGGGSRQPGEAVDVEEGLVDRQPLDQRRCVPKHLEHVAARL